MPAARAFSEVWLVNGSAGDPVLYLDYPGADNAFLFDAGDNGPLDTKRLADLEAVFLTHHHIDHFVGFDRILRANLDRDKVLRVYGPAGTIRRVYDRLKSYDFQYFPFMKIVLDVTELEPGAPGVRRDARLECAKKFPEPVVAESPWVGRTVHENAHLTVEAVHVDHTVPCLAFALCERPGYHPDPRKLAGSALRPGAWLPDALQRLRAGEPPETELVIGGGRFTLGRLAEMAFEVSPGAKVAYVTDTAWTDATREALVPLAKGAWRLYCDSFYASAQLKNAQQHRHMVAAHAAELAKLAKVETLVLMHFASRYAGKYQPLIDEARAVFPRTEAEVEPRRPGPAGA